MGGNVDRHFESTYVGHFINDGTSYGLRRTSSIRRQRRTSYIPISASKTDLNSSINTEEISSTTSESLSVNPILNPAVPETQPIIPAMIPLQSTLSCVPDVPVFETSPV